MKMKQPMMKRHRYVIFGSKNKYSKIVNWMQLIANARFLKVFRWNFKFKLEHIVNSISKWDLFFVEKVYKKTAKLFKQLKMASISRYRIHVVVSISICTCFFLYKWYMNRESCVTHIFHEVDYVREYNN